ncbi:accessory Sec system glycosyltransferase Asp1 [Levilactobacillus lindianensis]|uniref:accessory Sec system glycosyltransferase Asp1 n=1 Tax=Levilactobacillus lindianensis TaxID=2486018 RepID=UPI000F738EE1|nr:accessory Sec system glycosyltransferase Asp1 [Levilactobacillus lindianensis]
MNYFVAVYFNAKLTGIEQGQVNRLKLFKAANLPAKCVYTRYNPGIHANAERFGIGPDCFSLYDYFQDTVSVPVKAIDWCKYWEETCHFRLQEVASAPDIRIFTTEGRFLMYAHFRDESLKQLVYLNYFDAKRMKVKREHYDSRGFLSRVSYLHDNQKVQNEVYLDTAGHVKIEKYYTNNPGEPKLHQIILNDYRGQQWFFDTERELQTFFFNELYQAGDVYFSDKNGPLAPAFGATRPDVTVCAVFHSTHARDQANVIEGPLKNTYRYVLDHPEQFDRIVVSTSLQRTDLMERFPNLPPVVVIPVGYTTKQRVNLRKKKPHRIIGVARLSPEKQVMEQVQVVGRLVDEFPDIELHLFGFGSRVEEQRLRDYVTEHQLTDHVFFRGYLPDLTAEYEQASLEMVTSVEEGFSLTTLEALSFGVPVISYDIRYGPNEMVVDGENGNLVERNNQDLLYWKVRDYLKDPKLQRRYMKNSLKRANDYSATATRQKWQALLADLAE